MQVRSSVAGLGVMVAALALVTPAVAQQDGPSKQAAPSTACTLALTPQALKVQADPFQVKAVLSQALGSVGSASIEESSGIDIAVSPASAGEAAAAPAPAASAQPKHARKQPASGPSASASPSNAAAAQPAAAESAAGQELQLLLKTASAKPGDYTLTVSGEKGTCTGKLHVDAAGPSQ